MNTTLAALIVFGCLVGAVLLGRALGRLLPGNHWSTESEDAVKLAMEAARRMCPGEVGSPGQLAPNMQASNAVYSAIEANREKPNEPHATRPPVGRTRPVASVPPQL